MVKFRVSDLFSTAAAALTLLSMVFVSLVTPATAQKINSRSATGIFEPTPQGEEVESKEELQPEGACGTISLTSGGNSTSNNFGNIRTYSGGGVGVRVSAFGKIKSTGAFETGFLGQFGSAGLGAQDRVEGPDEPHHRVDNVGTRHNYVVFEFNQLVDVNSVRLESVEDDSDITYWIGTANDPYNNHLSLNDALLNSFGPATDNNAANASSRTASINGGNKIGNVLVVAASVSDETPNDWFKIQSVNVSCAPQTATLTIIKQVETFDNQDQSAQAFSFTTTGPGMQNFALVDGNVTGPDRHTKVLTTFGAAGTVTVTEVQPFSWTLLDLNCTSNVPNGNLTVDFSNAKFTLVPTAGSSTTCTFVNGLNIPSAAPASVSGRVMLASSRPVGGAILSILDVQTGETRILHTNSFGYYRFEGLEVGRLYVLTIKHKRFFFSDSTRMFTLSEDLTDVDFHQTF